MKCPVHDVLTEAEALASQLDDRPRMGRVLAMLANYFAMGGDADEAVAHGRRATSMAAEQGDVEVQVLADLFLGQASWVAGDSRRAVEAFSRAVASTESRRHEHMGQVLPPSVSSRNFLSRCLSQQGEFAEALRLADEAMQIADEIDHPNSRINAYIDAAWVHLSRSDPRLAVAALERGVELCRTWNAQFLCPVCASLLAEAYARIGRLAEAVVLAEESDERSRTMEAEFVRSHVLIRRAEVCLHEGRRDETGVIARNALDRARRFSHRGLEARASYLIGELATCENSPDVGRAETHYRGALALAEPRGMRPLVAHCHLGLGKLYRRTGKQNQAQEHLTTATTMYREMDMRFWLEQAEVEVKELSARN